MTIFFDHCISRRIVEFLRDLSAADGDGVVVEALTDRYQARMKEAEWIPLVNKRAGLIVVTMDRGKRERAVWESLMHPVILIEEKLANQPLVKIAETILRTWPEILRCSRVAPAPRSRFHLRLDGKQGKMMVLRGGGQRPVPLKGGRANAGKRRRRNHSSR